MTKNEFYIKCMMKSTSFWPCLSLLHCAILPHLGFDCITYEPHTTEPRSANTLGQIQDDYTLNQSSFLLSHKHNGLVTENKGLWVSHHHSSFKYQISVTLDCVMLECLIKKCWLKFHEKSLEEFWLGIRMEFPKLSEVALCIVFPVCYYICMWNGVRSTDRFWKNVEDTVGLAVLNI